jgi:hypothetical protein
MAQHQIVCTEQEPVTAPRSHAHIVAVGTGIDRARATTRWTLSQVISAIDEGQAFYTVSPSTGKTALVLKVACGVCRHYIIRSHADAVHDNNLDNLRTCRFA